MYTEKPGWKWLRLIWSSGDPIQDVVSFHFLEVLIKVKSTWKCSRSKERGGHFESIWKKHHKWNLSYRCWLLTGKPPHLFICLGMSWSRIKIFKSKIQLNPDFTTSKNFQNNGRCQHLIHRHIMQFRNKPTSSKVLSSVLRNYTGNSYVHCPVDLDKEVKRAVYLEADWNQSGHCLCKKTACVSLCRKRFQTKWSYQVRMGISCGENGIKFDKIFFEEKFPHKLGLNSLYHLG